METILRDAIGSGGLAQSERSSAIYVTNRTRIAGLRSPCASPPDIRAIPRSALQKKIRDLTQEETAELELATDAALGRVEPPPQ